MGEDMPPMQMVRVINSTAEPDGTHRVYYLGVPSTVSTPQEAVAWTFGMTAEEYNVAMET